MTNKDPTITEETKAISRDMRELYTMFKNKQVTRDVAETLANIAGKNLRAQAILLLEMERAKELKLIKSDDQ